ncbi:13003_t:CDS:2 [Cetraspora pellucida]|uniref:13003_t:CDS:1 n=1 Tax=Cetraspora pellucida TaxID=1433469 RepID=A0A9N8WDJ5_9GLOM|nr:13003_t:CDS:2 [Cetraspora pellucida]
MSQSSSAVEKPRAEDLPCVFSTIASKYSKLSLRPCETKESQTWRHADTPTTTNWLKLYVDYMPKLNFYLYLHSICEKHFNQVISTNHFHRHLLDNPAFKNKRLRFNASSDSPTSTYNSNTREEINELYLETSHIRNYEHTITILQQQLQEQENRELTMITEFQRNIENQEQVILKLRRQLEERQEVIVNLKGLLSDEVDRNEELVKHWDSRYSNQDKRIQVVTDIALIERNFLYENRKKEFVLVFTIREVQIGPKQRGFLVLKGIVLKMFQIHDLKRKTGTRF